MSQPVVKVGIMSAPTISFKLMGGYQCDGTSAEGSLEASIVDGKICAGSFEGETLEFAAETASSLIELHDVTIGVNFHWERKETQRFVGNLRLIIEGDKITAINILPVEEYLCSVISSEMSASASAELLKAHAVISRSWLMAQIDKDATAAGKQRFANPAVDTDEELIRWWDRDDHHNFDVCADDHCQRYQGVTRQTTAAVAQAVKDTAGQVLTSDGVLCDARFSKCCGGVFERFENCWEPIGHKYLQPLRDSVGEHDFHDLTIEANAREWILGRPAAFCNTSDKEILGQVLNNYDQETTDFYRWRVEYTADELSRLVKERSGLDYGRIIALEPVARGTSGRLWKLRIVGTKRTRVIGKELEIRRTLSTSHLYSSAFVVEPLAADATGHPSGFVLHGAGWGHGVGLCQIGAAVMGAHGFDYQTILKHYFVGANITQLY